MHTQKIRQKEAKRQNCSILYERKRSGITQRTLNMELAELPTVAVKE